MKTPASVVIRPFLRMVLFALICAGTSVVRAEEVRQERFRGPVVSVEMESKTITVTTRNGARSAQWDEASDIRSPNRIRTFDGLKPGMFVIIYLNENGKIARVRHQPENEEPVAE